MLCTFTFDTLNQKNQIQNKIKYMQLNLNLQERIHLITFGYLLYNFKDTFTCIYTIQPQMLRITSAFIFVAPAGRACVRLRVV